MESLLRMVSFAMLSPSGTCSGTLWKYYEKLKDATGERKK